GTDSWGMGQPRIVPHRLMWWDFRGKPEGNVDMKMDHEIKTSLGSHARVAPFIAIMGLVFVFVGS
ncbi:MAG: hypothetical protein AAB317_01080, partial [Nitrospirota bacterium]